MRKNRKPIKCELPRIDEASDEFADAKLKAIVIGGSFYFQRRMQKVIERNKIELPYRSQLLIDKTDEALARKEWAAYGKSTVHNLAYVFAGILALDNAYMTTFSEIVEEYTAQLKRDGLMKG